jgi:PKD repeat protein
VELAAAKRPETTSFRVVVSDGAFKTDRRLSVTPVNLPPEVLSLQAASAEVLAGRPLSFTATARDGDGDPLAYQWECSPGCWWPWPYPTEATAAWTAPWNLEDRTYSIQVRATDGALHDLASVEVTVLGRPDPTVSLAATPVDGLAPLEVTLSATAEDPVGQIVKYAWSIQKLSPWRYYSSWGHATTGGDTLARTLAEPGTFRAQVSATNDIGRSVSSDWVDLLVLAAPTVGLTVDVSKAPIPLTVGFTARASDADGKIAEYRWDFEGDGTVDETTKANTATHTYEQAGTFQARVTAVDDDGITGSATIGITATGRPLSASLSAKPQEGFAPLKVAFTAAADPDPVAEYRWDFDGDGTVDETTTSNTATHTYESIGGFPAQVKAVAEDGGTATAFVLVFVLYPLPPSVTLTADPASGGAPLGVTFTAAATDLDGQVVEYRWDFDGDATADQTTTVNTASHTYNESGVFTAAVTAVDDHGLTGTDTVTINVTACRTAVPPAGQTLPHVFVGTASIDGTPAPDGTRVVALVGCDVAGAAVTSGGSYTLQVAPAQGESYAGKTITFTVGGFATGQTATWELGGGTILNLTASAPSGG